MEGIYKINRSSKLVVFSNYANFRFHVCPLSTLVNGFAQTISLDGKSNSSILIPNHVNGICILLSVSNINYTRPKPQGGNVHFAQIFNYKGIKVHSLYYFIHSLFFFWSVNIWINWSKACTKISRLARETDNRPLANTK